MSDNTATLLDEPDILQQVVSLAELLALVPFILKVCNVWQYFSAPGFIL